MSFVEYVAYMWMEREKEFWPITATWNKDEASLVPAGMKRDDINRIEDKTLVAGGYMLVSTGISAVSRKFAILRGDFLFFFKSEQPSSPILVLPLRELREVRECSKDVQTKAPTADLLCEFTNGDYSPMRLGFTSEMERQEWHKEINFRVHRQTKHPPPPTETDVVDGWPKKGTLIISPIKLGPKREAKANPKATAVAVPLPPPPPPPPSLPLVATAVNQDAPPPPPPPTPAVKAKPTKPAKPMTEFERRYSQILDVNIEAKRRAISFRARIQAPEWVEKMRARENGTEMYSEGGAMTLAEQLRVLLFFRGIDLVEDPSPDAASQVPHLKGDVAESMIIHIYQHYCQINIAHPDTMSMGQNKGASRNFMSLEEFILFMDDCGVGGTHVPRDESDRPQQSYKDQLDPVRLVLSTQSPNLGGVGMEADAGAASKLAKALSMDPFIIDFAKFYQLLIRISQIVYKTIVYKDIAPTAAAAGRRGSIGLGGTVGWYGTAPGAYNANMTTALNKVLHECIAPLYAWCHDNHSRSGCVDVLLLEGRVGLLLDTYAPNLWRVFLTYAQDVYNKPPEMSLPFPLAAQQSERALFLSSIQQASLPLPLPAPSSEGAKALFLTEKSTMSLLHDYGITPSLLSKDAARGLFRSLRDRPKLFQTHKGATIPSAPALASTLTMSATHKSRRPSVVALLQSSPRHGGSVSSASSPTHSHFSSHSHKHEARGGSIHSDFPSTSAFAMKYKYPSQGASSSALASRRKAHSLATPSRVHEGGASFSEFLELLALVAQEGMREEDQAGMNGHHYHTLFPSLFQKLLALLTVWGVANLKVLEEIHALKQESVSTD